MDRRMSKVPGLLLFAIKSRARSQLKAQNFLVPYLLSFFASRIGSRDPIEVSDISPVRIRWHCSFVGVDCSASLLSQSPHFVAAGTGLIGGGSIQCALCSSVAFWRLCADTSLQTSGTPVQTCTTSTQHHKPASFNQAPKTSRYHHRHHPQCQWLHPPVQHGNSIDRIFNVIAIRQAFRASDIHPNLISSPSAQAHKWHPACAAFQVTSATPPPPPVNIQLSHIESSLPIHRFCCVAVSFRTTSWCFNTTQIGHHIPSAFGQFTFCLSPACDGLQIPGRHWSTAAYLDLLSPYPFLMYHIHLICRDTVHVRTETITLWM